MAHNMDSQTITKLRELTALSPLDGRYANKTTDLGLLFSEFGLIKARLEIEIKWLVLLAKQPNIEELESFTNSQIQELSAIYQNFTPQEALRIKEIEVKTNHDVKAVEYYINERLQNKTGYAKYHSFIHFGCTSEDINNLSYSILLNECRSHILNKHIDTILSKLTFLGKEYQSHGMLSRTHGQSATPTTMGKELINFAYRLNKGLGLFKNSIITGKFNGAVGNYNAHMIAYPNINWPELAKLFIENLGLEFNPYTTQINPHDDIAEYCHNLIKLNNILLDLVKDLWGYIALGYFKQKLNPTEVGSSTMPHKVNPIDFENAEGNLGLANCLLEFFSNKLPISRWQRDLSDSTVLRNLGSAFGYCSIAYISIQKGLDKLSLNHTLLKNELNLHWEVLAEPIQTVMRRYGISDAYEQLKELTRGTELNQALLHEFINSQALPSKVKESLKKLTPDHYLGYAPILAMQFEKD